MAILALAVSIEMGAQGIIRPKTTPAPNVTHTTPSKSKTQKRTVQTRKSGPSRKQLLDQAVHDMVRVEGGTYTMGLTKGMQDAVGWASPAHRVTVSSFFISKYEVTQALWRAVMGSNPSRFKGDNRPVEHVSWDDCQLFLSRLRTLTGYSFRLPTEAEWEYAARGGKYAKGCRYSGSNNLGEVGKYYGNSHDTLPVEGSRKPNELRLYDMTGSVHELCSDYMGDYSAEEQVCPVGPAAGSERVMRGGSFGDDPINCRISARFGIAPDKRASNVGLRLALSL